MENMPVKQQENLAGLAVFILGVNQNKELRELGQKNAEV
jgi:hypothetical protein